jgi:hypothetical protein
MKGPVEAPISVEDYAATIQEDKELLKKLETGKGIDGSANWQAIKSDTMLLIEAAIWIEQGGGVDGFELPATSRKNIKQAPAKIGDNGMTASAASYMAYVLKVKGSEHVGPYASQKMIKNRWTAVSSHCTGDMSRVKPRYHRHIRWHTAHKLCLTAIP